MRNRLFELKYSKLYYFQLCLPTNATEYLSNDALFNKNECKSGSSKNRY